MQKAFWHATLALGVLTSGAHAQTISVAGSLLSRGGRQLVLQMPEPSSPMILVIDLLSVAALVFWIRRRELHNR